MRDATQNCCISVSRTDSIIKAQFIAKYARPYSVQDNNRQHYPASLT